MNKVKAMLDFLFRKKNKSASSAQTVQNNGDKLEGTNAFQLVPYGNCKASGADVFAQVMTVADCHGKLMMKEVEDLVQKHGIPAIVFFLGDNTVDDVECVLEVLRTKNDKKAMPPMFGVVGNHDSWSFYERKQFAEIHALHFFGRTRFPSYMEIPENFSISGIGGSIRYTDSSVRAMLTNEESVELLNASHLLDNAGYEDVLIAHSNPCFEAPERITSHSGLLGIGEYIKKCHPQIVLHGHLHERYIKWYGDTIIRCCYGVECFEIGIKSRGR